MTRRPLETGEYCLWGPMSVPHVKVQVLLQPGETRDLAASLPFGSYRFRTLEPGPEAEVDWRSGGMPALILEEGTATAGAPASAGMLRLANRAPRALTAIVEDRAWVADALTADRVTALQTFRDLFSDDVLRQGNCFTPPTVRRSRRARCSRCMDKSLSPRTAGLSDPISALLASCQ
jgi:hypothetical protein